VKVRKGDNQTDREKRQMEIEKENDGHREKKRQIESESKGGR
jgi:hypothetical protein